MVDLLMEKRWYSLEKCSKPKSQWDTVVSRYYDTAGIRKKYHYIQTIEISSINFYCFEIVGILIWYHNMQYFELSDILITRDYCNTSQCEWKRAKITKARSSERITLEQEVKEYKYRSKLRHVMCRQNKSSRWIEWWTSRDYEWSNTRNS